MLYTIEAMTPARADDIAGWIYEREYALYSFERTENTIAELLGGDYIACLDGNGLMVGFFCAGQSARIPSIEGYAYPDGALDIGLGLRPELCGKGLGRGFMLCGMAHYARTESPMRLRLTVARFNRRAIALYSALGFAPECTITHRTLGIPFDVMVRRAGSL